MTFEPSMSRCYEVIAEMMNWTGARAHCGQISPGVHLVDLQSAAEDALVTGLVETAAPLGRYIDGVQYMHLHFNLQQNTFILRVFILKCLPAGRIYEYLFTFLLNFEKKS
jgi:hypothetical protein